MKNILTGLVGSVIGRSSDSELLTPRDEKAELISNIQKAHDEWMAARAYFESVADPNLIDYAVLSVEAAEKKYTYLMNKARECGLKGDIDCENHDAEFRVQQ